MKTKMAFFLFFHGFFSMWWSANQRLRFPTNLCVILGFYRVSFSDLLSIAEFPTILFFQQNQTKCLPSCQRGRLFIEVVGRGFGEGGGGAADPRGWRVNEDGRPRGSNVIGAFPANEESASIDGRPSLVENGAGRSCFSSFRLSNLYFLRSLSVFFSLVCCCCCCCCCCFCCCCCCCCCCRQLTGREPEMSHGAPVDGRLIENVP